MVWIKNLALICASTLLPVIVFLLVDLSIGLSRLDAASWSCSVCERNEMFKEGWYELKPNFDRQVYFTPGKLAYRVITDEHRFRIGPDESRCSDLCTDLLFLGDSFTFGVNGNWEDTFVGMVQSNTNGFNVINGGNGSYSVTPYNYIYRRYLRTRDSDSPHLVVIAVDLSDVIDEAGYWKAGVDHPVKYKWNLEWLRNRAERNSLRDTEWPLKAYLPYTHSIFGYVKYTILRSDHYIMNKVAFTYLDWNQLDKHYPVEGFLPLGVSGGIAKVKSGLKKLVGEIEKHNGKAIFLIYPWPNQLVFEDTHFDWSEFISTICEEESCEGVVDLIPVMRQYKQSHPIDWYSDLYLTGDVHFNAKGNKLVAEEVLRFLDSMKSDAAVFQK